MVIGGMSVLNYRLMTNSELLERVRSAKLKAGKAEYLKHLKGEPLSRAEAVRARRTARVVERDTGQFSGERPDRLRSHPLLLADLRGPWR